MQKVPTAKDILLHTFVSTKGTGVVVLLKTLKIEDESREETEPRLDSSE